MPASVLRFFLSTAAAVLLVCGCGAGEGTERLLPPGPQTTAPPGDLVMYVSEGQTNRVAAYRLGTDGLLPANPFSTLDVENPRRLLLRDDILYIALPDGVASVALGADGSLPSSVTSTTDPVFGANALDLLIVDDVLYVALEALRVVAAYRLQNGQLTPNSISLSGTNSSNYLSLATRGPFIYAGATGSQRIDTYLINPGGTLDDEPIPQSPETIVGLPQDLLIVDDNLYVSDANRQRLLQYEILNTGLLPKDPLTESKSVEFYARIIENDATLYAGAFNKGQIDLYGLDPSTGALVSNRSFFSTFQDVETFPNGIIIENGILYVTQSGRDRVDAYILGADGVPSSFPSSSTVAIVDSFPNDVVMGVFPP